MVHITQSRATVARILALGLLLAALVFAPRALAAKPAHASTTFTVNFTSDRSDLDFPGGVFDGSLDGKCCGTGRRGSQVDLNDLAGGGATDKLVGVAGAGSDPPREVPELRRLDGALGRAQPPQYAL